MRKPNLGLVLASVLSAACGTSGSSSGTSAGDGGVSSAGFVAFECTGGPAAAIVIQPDLEVDHLEQRVETEGGDAGTRTVQVLSTRGEPCKTAGDQARCKERLAALRLDSSCGPDGNSITGRSCKPYFVSTRGDAISSAVTGAEIAALAGKINSPDELRLVVASAGYSLACGGASVTPEYKDLGGGAFEVHAYQAENCAPAAYAVTVNVDGTGKVTETSRTTLADKPSCAVAGRRPDGFVQTRGTASAAEHIATMATLEAAAVQAFREIAHTLSAMGANRQLQARVRTATRDEIRHARQMRRLAAQHGHAPTAASHAPYVLPSRQEFARRNMIEGCVRETFGAMIAAHQAAHAQDLSVRAAMQRIAADELRHADLSWDIASWLDETATPSERRAVYESVDRALAELEDELLVELPDDARRALGLPTQAQAMAMLQSFAHSLLAARAA